MVDLNSTILLIIVNENYLNTSIKSRDCQISVCKEISYRWPKIKVLKVNIAFNHKLKENWSGSINMKQGRL